MVDLFRLDGKVAVVVGGGGGIGKALALGLARYGANVALCSRNLEKLQGVADELSADPEVKNPVKAFQMDATDEASVKAATWPFSIYTPGRSSLFQWLTVPSV